jgi:[NiFe] hydrogenase assembly HybE family chaperone
MLEARNPGGEASGGAPFSPAAGESLSRNLEAVFRGIERERMRDVPILNPALSVACVGMRAAADGWICILVTPWFINLIALPGDESAAQSWSRTVPGDKSMRELPAGSFEFISASEEGIGPYRMCSLFSPVLEFENQEAALAVAEASLAAVFDAGLDPANADAAKPEEAAKEPPPGIPAAGTPEGSLATSVIASEAKQSRWKSLMLRLDARGRQGGLAMTGDALERSRSVPAGISRRGLLFGANKEKNETNN